MSGDAQAYLVKSFQTEVLNSHQIEGHARNMEQTRSQVNYSMSTAFHPQTDGETERVNQELEQYLRVFCNYQVDNWADSDLIPFMKFAHNARAHSTTGHSPFQVWYGYQPEFIVHTPSKLRHYYPHSRRTTAHYEPSP